MTRRTVVCVVGFLAAVSGFEAQPAAGSSVKAKPATPTNTPVSAKTATPTSTPTFTSTPITSGPYVSAVLSDSPLAYYRLDQSGGTSAADSSGHGNTGTYNGTVTFGAAGATGDGDTALSLPGVSTASVSSPTLTPGAAFTLECWVQPNNFLATNQHYERLFSTSLGTTNLLAYVPAVVGSSLSGKFVVEMGGAVNFATTHTYAAGSWYHVVYTWDGTTQTIYVNGVADATGSAAATTAPPSWGGTTYLGADPLATNIPGPLQGLLDDAAIYPSALSAARVLAHYTAPTITPTPTNTPVPGATATPTPTPTNTAVPTPTPVGPTKTPTKTPLPTSTSTVTLTPTRTLTPTPAAAPIPLGAYIAGVSASTPQPLDSFASLVKKTPAMSWYEQDWGDAPSNSAFNSALMNAYRSRGIIPMVSLEPSVANPLNNTNQPSFNWQAISSGAQDAFLTQWATDAKNYGYPLYVRLMHEMNGTWYPWGYNVNGNTNTADYVNAYRHVVTLFRSVGATNVRFIWCVSTAAGTTNDAALYPGDAYVDWVGMDGYNSATSPWVSFFNRFSTTYTTLTGLTTKPIIIFETASLENTSASPSKASWIQTAFLTDLPQSFPKVRGIMWYDQTGPQNQNYPVDSSSASLSAYKTAVANSYYTGSMPAAPALPTATPGACPVGWSCSDVGSPSPAGTQYLNNGSWTIMGSGADIWGTADQFHFVSQPLTGNGSISADVTSQSETHVYAKTGVMIRQSTDPGAPFYALLVTPINGLLVEYRTTQGAAVTQVGTVNSASGAAPIYLKVTQAGGVYTAYSSSDGVSWTLIPNSSIPLTMTGTPLAGLAVCSHLAGQLNESLFSNVHVG